MAACCHVMYNSGAWSMRKMLSWRSKLGRDIRVMWVTERCGGDIESMRWECQPAGWWQSAVRDVDLAATVTDYWLRAFADHQRIRAGTAHGIQLWYPVPVPLRLTSCARGRTICPAPVRRALRPSSSPYTPHACGTQRALLPVAVGTSWRCTASVCVAGVHCWEISLG